jgi:hypothetical protein
LKLQQPLTPLSNKLVGMTLCMLPDTNYELTQDDNAR